MKLVVLTGGIACGKTTVANILKKKYNIPIVDSDKITYQLQEPGGEAYVPIVKYFGESILNEDKTLNRKQLGNIIFQNREKRLVLNKIVHPLVLKTLFKNTVKHWIEREPIVILDIPLFFEIKMPKFLFNDIITVSTNKELQLQRLMKRNTLTEEEAKNRINSQMPLEIKCKNSTIVINNETNIEDLENQIDSIVKNWKRSNPILTLYQDPMIVLIVFLVFIFLSILKYLM